MIEMQGSVDAHMASGASGNRDMNAEAGFPASGEAVADAVGRAGERHGEVPHPAPVCAIIVSGGTGSRFGNPGGKQLVNVAGRPMMTWPIMAFDRSCLVGHIVVVCPYDRRAEMRRVAIDPFEFNTPITFADAGETRQDSTRAGVEAVPLGFTYVAIHDGARPLITTEAIDRAISALMHDRSLDGVVCGQPAIDTLKIVDGDRIESTPPRSLYWAAQTPQIFSVDAMRRAHAAALADGFVGTDDSSLVERIGGSVRCVESPRDNLKVTVPEDLAPVTAILHGRMSDAESAQDTGIIGRVPLV